MDLKVGSNELRVMNDLADKDMKKLKTMEIYGLGGATRVHQGGQSDEDLMGCGQASANTSPRRAELPSGSQSCQGVVSWDAECDLSGLNAGELVDRMLVEMDQSVEPAAER